MSQSVKFIFQQDAQRIFRYFTRTFGIRIVFFSSDGQEINVGDNRPPCRYCSLLRNTLGFEYKCHQTDRKKQLLAAANRRLVTYQCHAKMTEAIMPVYAAEKLIGFIMIGQFRISRKFEPPKWLKTSQNHVMLKQLAAAYREAPFYPPEMVKNILGLFAVLVEFIVGRHLINIKNSQPIERIIAYLDEHPEEMLSLTDAADLLRCSVSSLSHRFKETVNTSFKNYQLARKLDIADEYMDTQPELSIAQIARRLGFKDPMYFSRLYKKYRGKSPRYHRNSRRKQKTFSIKSRHGNYEEVWKLQGFCSADFLLSP
jgi:AraC-like DNA-binding protein/ligand-binding sensor protein